MKTLYQNDIDRLTLAAGYGAGGVTIPREDFEALLGCYEEHDEDEDLHGEIADLEEDLSAAKSEATELRGEIEELKTDISKLETDNFSLSEEIEELKNAGFDLV